MSDLGVGTSFEGARCTITVTGEARLETAQRFEEVGREIAAAGATEVLVDLTQLVFMDSASAGMLLRLQKQLGESGGVMVLFGMRRLVSRLLERTGLDEQFQCAEGRAEAIALLG
jgi:anti-sigma B factor antagonist